MDEIGSCAKGWPTRTSNRYFWRELSFERLSKKVYLGDYMALLEAKSLAERRLVRKSFPMSIEKLLWSVPYFWVEISTTRTEGRFGGGSENRFSCLYYLLTIYLKIDVEIVKKNEKRKNRKRRDLSARTKTLDASWLKARSYSKRRRCKAGTIRRVPMIEGGKFEYEYSELSTDCPSSEMRNTVRLKNSGY